MLRRPVESIEINEELLDYLSKDSWKVNPLCLT